MRPNFLVVGATKSGTTSLYRALAGHPEVWLHLQKELRYFTAEHHHHRGRDWYEAYSRAPVYAGVPARIAAFNPGMRLDYLIRDPMRRLESHYRHRHRIARPRGRARRRPALCRGQPLWRAGAGVP